MEGLIAWGLTGLGAYLVLGFLFAVAFHWRGLRRIDPSAERGTWGFRVLVTPGIVALWPVLWRRWARAADGLPEENSAHRRAARGSAS